MNHTPVPIQRYRVSLWTYQFSAPNEDPLHMRKEIVAATAIGALRNVMRQANITTAFCARVVAVRSGSYQLIEQISLS